MSETLTELSKMVRCTATYGAPYNEEMPEHDPWTVTLTYQGRRMRVPFYMGRGLKGAEPDCETVLECLLSDALSGEQDFENFASDMGLDTDSRKAEKTWKLCQSIAKRLRHLLGEDFERFTDADR